MTFIFRFIISAKYQNAVDVHVACYRCDPASAQLRAYVLCACAETALFLHRRFLTAVIVILVASLPAGGAAAYDRDTQSGSNRSALTLFPMPTI